jgi:hypothetical protein
MRLLCVFSAWMYVRHIHVTASCPHLHCFADVGNPMLHWARRWWVVLVGLLFQCFVRCRYVRWWCERTAEKLREEKKFKGQPTWDHGKNGEQVRILAVLMVHAARKGIGPTVRVFLVSWACCVRDFVYVRKETINFFHVGILKLCSPLMKRTRITCKYHYREQWHTKKPCVTGQQSMRHVPQIVTWSSRCPCFKNRKASAWICEKWNIYCEQLHWHTDVHGDAIHQLQDGAETQAFTYHGLKPSQQGNCHGQDYCTRNRSQDNCCPASTSIASHRCECFIVVPCSKRQRHMHKSGEAFRVLFFFFWRTVFHAFTLHSCMRWHSPSMLNSSALDSIFSGLEAFVISVRRVGRTRQRSFFSKCWGIIVLSLISFAASWHR